MTTAMTLRLPDDMAQSLDFIAHHFDKPKSRCMIAALKKYIAEKMEEIEDGIDGELAIEALNTPNLELISLEEALKRAAEVRNV